MAALIRSVRYGGSVLTRFYLAALFVNDTQQSVAQAPVLDQYLYVVNRIPSESIPMINDSLPEGNGRFFSGVWSAPTNDESCGGALFCRSRGFLS
jgi:hypothetical protein